ncbi:MAG: type II toxin-antitoxin system RelE/ParE family toxin [Candidatus Competibacteraceae bacterium]|nr:type II toxin-antitoxin system RelE/ParE family toxin [Candidatus Competibacteraceae bacterium]
MSDFRVTPRAKEDLKNIGHYTLKKWGRKQRDIYLMDLDKRFTWLARNPHIGKQRPDVQEGYYCFPQGSHLVFYLLRENGIDIIGILHQNMDVQNYFNG